MAWGKAEIDPKEILGMSPDELQQKLGRLDELDQKLSTVTEGQSKTAESLNAILAKLDAKTSTKQEDADPDLEFLANPSEILNSRVSPLERQTIENTVMLQHRSAREQFPQDFERWGTEIAKKMGELSAAQQADPRVWKAMVMMVRGEHASDLEKDGATGKFTFLEPVSAGIRQADAKDGLTRGEREMVKTLAPFGMTPEKYNNGKKRLEKARAARLGRFAEVG